MAGESDRRGFTDRVWTALTRQGPRTVEPEEIRPDEQGLLPEPPVPSSAEGPTSSQLACFLAGELRLPFAALSRLGARCAASGDPELAAVGRAVARECERLDILVTNTLELGLIGEESDAAARPDQADLVDLVEKVVAGHRALVEGLSIRVRVLESTRVALVRCNRQELLETLAALLSDLLERVPRGAHVDVRVREVIGFARVDVACRDAIPANCTDRTTLLRARGLAVRWGGELWEVGEADGGFGLALPLLGNHRILVRRTAPAGACQPSRS